MPEERLRPLLVKYDEFLNQNRVFTQRCGPRSLACASAATPSGLIGPTRREDRSIGSSRRSWGNMAPHSRRRLAKRHRIDRSAPRGSDPVGRRDGEATESEPGRQGTGPANAIGVRARNARHVGREAFRPQRGSASPPLAKPFGRGRSRPSSGMAASCACSLTGSRPRRSGISIRAILRRLREPRGKRSS